MVNEAESMRESDQRKKDGSTDRPRRSRMFVVRVFGRMKAVGW